MIDLLDLHKQFILTHIGEGDTVVVNAAKGPMELKVLKVTRAKI